MTTITRRGFHKLAGSVLGSGLGAAWLSSLSPLAMDAALPEMTPEGLPFLSLTEVSGMIREHKVTSVELVNALLARITVYNPKVNCYVTVMKREALAQAAELDAEAKAGKFRGPLHGIPIALKDNIDTAGTRTTAASPMFKDRVPTEDADIVVRMKKAGAIILGKLNLHEFAIGCSGDISYFGPARNPWSLGYATGGSSSGSAAALAANMAFGTLGTDTGGSIRVPSAWCGTVGLKPTFGLVSIRGIIPCALSRDHCGPLARTVEDVALMLGQMTGYDMLDINSVESQPKDYVALMKAQPVKSLRISTPDSFYDHIDPLDEPAVRAALDTLSGLTQGVTSTAPLWDATPGGTTGDAEAYHHELIEKYGVNYMAPDRARFERLENPTPGTHITTAAESARDHQKLELVRRMIDSQFKDFDVVVVPTTRKAPPKINESLTNEMKMGAAAAASGKVYDWFAPGGDCTNTSPFDSYGIPAISVPCGFTKDGLPVGIMIAAPHFQEGRVLALAYAYQQATQWHTKRPTLTPSTPVPPIVEGKSPEDKKNEEREEKTDAKAPPMKSEK